MVSMCLFILLYKIQQITYDPMNVEESVPHVDFEVESKNHTSSAQIRLKITVTGVELEENEVFFTIANTKEEGMFHSQYFFNALPALSCIITVRGTRGCIHIPEWLFSEESELRQVLKNDSEKEPEENNIALNKEHSSQHFKADVFRFIADISLQVPVELVDQLYEEMHISQCDQQRLNYEFEDYSEQLYKAFFVWINRSRPHLLELKYLLQKVGFKDIVLSKTSKPPPLTLNHPHLTSTQCKWKICVRIANEIRTQWRFVGHYLGLDESHFSDWCSIAHADSRTEAVIQMLKTWMQQFSSKATVGSLVNALCRINDLNLCCMQNAVCFLEKVVKEELLQ